MRFAVSLFICLLASPVLALDFQVDDLADAVDATPGDGLCRTAAGRCSLRAALQESNALGGANRVLLPAGVFPLTLSGSGADTDAHGDLDVTAGVVEIVGQGSAASVIDATGRNHRVLELDGADAVFVEDVALRGGTATFGGCIRAYGATTTLRGVELSGGDAFYGGGIYSDQGNLEIEDSVIADNQGWYGGGGVYLETYEIVVRRTQLLRNRAEYGSGGGILARQTLVVYDTLFQDGFAFEGGGIHLSGIVSTLIQNIVRSSFVDNEAYDGGGIFLDAPHPTIPGRLAVSFSTFSGNRADRGAAVFARPLPTSSGPSYELNAVTLAHQDSSAGSAALHVDGATPLRIWAVLFASNTGGHCAGTIQSGGYNLADDASCAGLNQPSDLVADPLLGALTGAVPAYRTLASSPARDRILPGVGCGGVDQLGNPRPADGDGDGAAWCDVGSWEAQPAGPTCGLGIELVLGIPLLCAIRRRRRGPEPPSARTN